MDILDAARSGNYMNLIHLIQNGANLLSKSSSGCTALHWAARYNQIHCIKVLLEARIPINLPDELGYTALHWSVLLGHLETTQILLEYGASTSVLSRHSEAPKDMTRNPKLLRMIEHSGYENAKKRAIEDSYLSEQKFFSCSAATSCYAAPPMKKARPLQEVNNIFQFENNYKKRGNIVVANYMTDEDIVIAPSPKKKTSR